MRSYTQAFAERTGIRVIFKTDPSVENLSNEQTAVLYRVLQESLTNVAKHAFAHQVRIILTQQDASLSMEIEDDGKAFKVETCQALSSVGLGILGMQERVRSGNGVMMIRSVAGVGTTISVAMPFHDPSP